MHFHPRQDNTGNPVQIRHPHTPSPLSSWADHCQVATVVPDGPMPYRLNHVLFRPWKKAPATRPEWQDLSKWLDIKDPAFEAMGLQPAAGAVVVEPDGRVWLVAPTNAFGGSKVTFPKGQVHGMDLRATALKEVFEEAGLRVEILTHLIDVTRSTTRTRYFLARRTGGNPADMCWESQAVLLAPVEDLRSLLTKAVDHEVLAALLEQMGGWAGYFHKGKWEPDLAACKRALAPARRAHWPTLPLPRTRTTLALDIHLDKAEAACLRLGFIPSVMEEKWFAYMEGDTLYEHRSWTGYCIDQIHFVPEGDGLRATHAEVNRYHDQYSNEDDEEERANITTRVNQLAHMTVEDRNTEDGFVTAMKASMVPNYLGSPTVVAELLAPFLQAVVDRHIALTQPRLEALAGTYAEVIRTSNVVAKALAGEDPAYALIGAWNTAASLGAEAIQGLDLDPDYYADENLFCILSEGLAGVSIQVQAILAAYDQDPLGELERDLGPSLARLRDFLASVLMGTRCVAFPGMTLKDFTYTPAMEA